QKQVNLWTKNSCGKANTDPGQFSALSSSSCCVEFRHGKVTLENPSPELLVVLLRELTGRNQ
ncbi:IS66 family insertion sequence element accessory protein TnpB, partial [Salmonella enterica]